MEVLVLIDFEGCMKDELTVQAGDVVKNVVKAGEQGWLVGELSGKRGIFPSNFVKEVPVYLIGEDKREPRSLRKIKTVKKPVRKCEVAYTYTALNVDELDLVAGETIEILREIEDGWWMGIKNGKVGVFPSNFVKEIFVSPKDTKLNEGKVRPKLSDAVFNKEIKLQRTSVRNNPRIVKESCQVMFDYAAVTEDELDLKKGDIITILNKETEDEGWWEGELKGQRGFFPDNFVMVIPTDALQSGNTSQRPARSGTRKKSVSSEMEKSGAESTKDEKPDLKDLRSDTPGKVKLSGQRKAPPPPVKDKPNKAATKANGDVPLPSPNCPEDKEKVTDSEQFEGLDLTPEKLSHPTANRAKPPHRRPPSALVTGPKESEHREMSGEPEEGLKRSTVLRKIGENRLPSVKAEQPTQPAKTASPPKPESASLDSVRAEVKELRMMLDLFKTRHERDMMELREELREERNKRMALQEQIGSLKSHS